MKLHLPAPRLLPFTIAVLAAVLAMKTVDLVRHTVSSFNSASAGGMVSAAHAEAPEPPKAPAPVPATPSPAPPPAVAAPPPIADSERAILLDLRQRRKELDERDATLATRESVLVAAEQKLTARAEELGALQKKLQDIDGARQQHEDTAWQGLVKVYEAMKPRDAAVIFNDLQMPVLLPVIDRMKESKAAPVLAAMNPDKARDVTAGLAQLRTHRDASGATAQKGG